jgi:hypothetical protein
MCSPVIPAYSTGISQPAKGTIRAFEAWWRELRGVFLRAPEVFEALGSVGTFAVVTKL